MIRPTGLMRTLCKNLWLTTNRHGDTYRSNRAAKPHRSGGYGRPIHDRHQRREDSPHISKRVGLQLASTTTRSRAEKCRTHFAVQLCKFRLAAIVGDRTAHLPSHSARLDVCTELSVQRVSPPYAVSY